METAKKLTFLIVDDEAFIRSATKRVIINELKNLNECIDLTIVEAGDGIECLLALYLYNKNNIKFDAVISDETMPYISGSYLSKIIYELVSKGPMNEIKMFISTSLINANINNYSNIVKKIYAKPIDKSSVKDLLKVISN